MKTNFVTPGLSAALYLGGAVPLIFAVIFVGNKLVALDDNFSGLTGLTVVVGGLFLAGALWGRSVARRLSWQNTRWVMAATGLTYTVSMIAALQVLGTLERRVVEQARAGDLPVHVMFAILFTVATFVVMAVLGALIGGLARSGRLALKLALAAGTASALAFLLADLVQDLLGRRVGGPHAEATLTMLSVAFIGNLIAAFVGGGVMGWLLPRAREVSPNEREQTVAVEAPAT